jgi:outer membrane immunogenic protein
MRRNTLAALAAAGLALGTVQVASAADLARPVYKAPAPVVVAYNWTGLYGGLNIGYGWGEAQFGGFGNIKPAGVFGGGQIGYNWQGAGSPWVVGVEVDSVFANLKDDASDGVDSVSSKLDYFGTLRGRIGYAFDRALVYGTGGLAWGHNKVTAAEVGLGSVSESKNHVGWTVGAGLEWALVNNWTAKVEYLYVDLGSKNYFGAAGADVDVTAHTAKLGVNYRF